MNLHKRLSIKKSKTKNNNKSKTSKKTRKTKLTKKPKSSKKKQEGGVTLFGKKLTPLGKSRELPDELYYIPVIYIKIPCFEAVNFENKKQAYHITNLVINYIVEEFRVLFSDYNILEDKYANLRSSDIDKYNKKNPLLDYTLTYNPDDPESNNIVKIEFAFISCNRAVLKEMIETLTSENPYEIENRKYYDFKEYHTSLDNLNFVNGSQVFATFNLYRLILNKLENEDVYVSSNKFCEPMLSKFKLYPNIGGAINPILNQNKNLDNILWVLFYSNGIRTLSQIKKKINISESKLNKIIKKLKIEGLLQNV